MWIVGECVIIFIIKWKDYLVEFYMDFIFFELVVFGCFFNGIVGNGNVFVVYFFVIFE